MPMKQLQTNKTNTHWQIKKLGEICDFQNGFAFKSNLFKESGFPILRISNIQNDGIFYKRLVFFDKGSYLEDFDRYQVEKGDLVIAMSGATTGKLAISNIDEIFYLNQRVGKFKPNKYLSKDYLYYFLSTRIEENLRISSGSAQPNLSTEQIKNLEIPLPPLPTQHRIVKILDEVFEGIAKAKENAEKNLQNARELFESYLQSVFANTGDGWEKKTLEDVCEIQSKLIDPRMAEFLDLIHVGAGNIEIKTGMLINLKTSKEEKLISGKFQFDDSVVLYSKIRPYLMKVVRPNFQGLCSADIYPLLPYKKMIMRDYLFYLLLTSIFTEFAIKGSARAGMPKVNREHLFAFIFFLPPLSVQHRIVSKLDALSAETKKLESIYTQKLADLDELKKSILQKAFSGEL